MDLLFQPTQREGAAEAFRGFINLFDDHLAPQLIEEITIPVDLIWGELDPWEPLEEAYTWKSTFSNIRTIEVISGSGHCPHDENPHETNLKLINALFNN